MSPLAEAPGGEVLLYEAPEGEVQVDVRLDHETIWLTQRQMSGIFETTPENVLMHLKNVFGDGELEEGATSKDFLVVQTEGSRQVRRSIKHYNLDAIISVGYRVNSKRGVQFRQWATRVLPPSPSSKLPPSLGSTRLATRCCMALTSRRGESARMFSKQGE